MEPVSFLIGALVLTAFAKVGISATSDAYTTVKAAQAGAWDVIDRQRERRASFWGRLGQAWAERRRARHEAAGGDGEFRPGAREYAADLYHGFWESRLERRTAKRAARGPYVYDPDRPPWHRRFDDALLARVERLRERWGQYRADRQPVEDTPLDELLDREPLTEPAPWPVSYEPGTWTVDDRGERVELAPAGASSSVIHVGDRTYEPKVGPPVHGYRCDRCHVWEEGYATEEEARSASVRHKCAAPQPADSDTEHLGVVDAIYGTTETTGGTMTTPAAVATEVQTNEDARRCFAAMGEAAAEAAEALAALEAARAKMAAAAQGAADGMAAQRFDAGATAAANEAVDAIGLDTLAGWADKIDAVSGAATKGLAGLEKYRDAEDTVASNNVDASTLSAMSS